MFLFNVSYLKIVNQKSALVFVKQEQSTQIINEINQYRFVLKLSFELSIWMDHKQDVSFSNNEF
jgi:hypothetical protein